MAKLSTGQTYGETGRATSQRLLGGAEQMASGGALAQQSLGVPTLQPQAAPVNTFQQVGAPTLGGPVRTFAPPELPAASQDMANLARALGSFSPVLETFGQQYVEKLKVDDRRAELVGQQLAQDLQVKYPGQQLAELRDQLYRQAQAGDEGAARAYAKVQSLSPLQLAYANRFTQRANVQFDLAKAADEYNRLTEVEGPSGAKIPKEWLQPGDPRLQAAKTSLIRMPSDPVIFAEYQSQIYAKYAELDSTQTKIHNSWKEREFGAATNQLIGSLVQSRASVADAQLAISEMATSARIVLGAEGYPRWMEALEPSFQAAINVASLNAQGGIDYEKQQYLSGQKQVILAGVIAGPNGETYLQRLGAKGGAVAQLEGLQRSLSSLKEIKLATDTLLGYKGEKIASQVIDQFRLNDPALIGRDREKAAADARAYVMQMPPGPDQVEASQQVERAINAGGRVDEFSRNEAERRAYEIDRSGRTPEQKLKEYDRLNKEGLIDPGKLKGLVSDAERERSQRDRPAQNAIEEGIKQLLKKEQAFLVLPRQGQGLQQSEADYLINRNAQIRDEVNEIRRNGRANGASPQQIFQEQKKYVDGLGEKLQGRIDARAPLSARPIIQDVNSYYDQRGGFLGLGRGGRAPQATQLNGAVDAGLVMPEPAFKKALTEWVDKNILTDQTRQIIKDSGYGTKADDFFRKQWKNHYGMAFPEQYDGRMNDLKGQKVSYVPPAGGSGGLAMVNPSQMTAMRLASFLQNTGNAAMNALVPPAAAEPMPLAAVQPMPLAKAPARVTGPVVGRGLNANAKAWLAAISAQGFEGAGYNTYYGGGTFDNSKSHPMRVVRPKGGIASSAAGRYQFMPDTWTGLHGGKNPPMTPERQDAAAYKLALQAGIDLNTAKPTLANVRKLARIWAALPVNATGGQGAYKGQGGAGLRRFQQIWNTEFNRYSSR